MFKLASHPPGTAPGNFSRPLDSDKPPLIRCHLYHGDDYQCAEAPDLAAAHQKLRQGAVCWIDIQGAPDDATLADLQSLFGVHPLALEDFFDPAQRPKMEVFEQHLFFLIDRLGADQGKAIGFERLAIFLGEGWVVSLFPPDAGDFLSPIYERLASTTTRMRARPADYLAYALIDLVVDHFFLPLEKVGDRLEELEAQILRRATREDLSHIHALKVNLLRLRHRIWPMRELINAMIRDETRFIGNDTKVYVRDCYDHIVQIMEINENFREIAGGMLDLYLSSSSNRTNDIVKVLTIISAVFIPLTFIAGVYGMNFNPQASRWNMPELNQPYGYVACLAVMFMIVIVQLVIFKIKRWF